jgi:hypothetical protein
LIVAVFTYPTWRPRPVAENTEDIFPELSEDLRDGFTSLPQDIQEIYLTLRGENGRIAAALVTARLTPPERLIEDLPDISNAPQIAGGIFAPIVLPADEVDRELPPYYPLYANALGDVKIYRYPDERKILRLENFSIVNGPNLRVYLAVLTNPLNTEELGNTYIDLGALKSNSGNQNYDIPRELNLGDYASVVIYDLVSGHLFGVARIG